MSDYKSQIEQAYKKKVLNPLDQVTRKVALAVQADVAFNTPVDTGRARSNWLPSIGTPRRDTIEDRGGSPEIDFNGYKLGETIFISNNLPYIGALNNGSSKQSPAGFVDDAIMRVNRKAKQFLKVMNDKL